MAVIDSGSLNLAQYAQMSNDPKVLRIVLDLISHGSVYGRDIPFLTKESMSVATARQTDLPAIKWTVLNEKPETVSSAVKQFKEQAYLSRQTIKTDMILDRDENQIDNPHAIAVRAVLASFSYTFNDIFINNHHRDGGKTEAFVGLRERLDFADKYSLNSNFRVDGSGADMTPSGTAADFAALLEKIRKLFINLGSPTGTGLKIYVNDDLFVRIQTKCALLAGQGGFGTGQDQFGRTVSKFMDAEFHPIGTRDGQTDQIITSTETNTGIDGASTFTSLYIVNYNANGIAGWQFEPISVKPLPAEEGVLKSSIIEWCGGIMTQSSRSAARIYNIKIS